MSAKDEHRAGLVPSQSVALTSAGAAALEQRGLRELLAKSHAEAWLKKGQEFWDQKNYPEAVSCFKRGLEYDPDHADIAFRLGGAYVRDDEFAIECRHFKEGHLRSWGHEFAEPVLIDMRDEILSAVQLGRLSREEALSRLLRASTSFGGRTIFDDAIAKIFPEP